MGGGDVERKRLLRGEIGSAMTKIFISYSVADAPFVGRLRGQLRAWGHTAVFVDRDPETGIPPGAEWRTELYQRIAEAQAVLAVCSTSSAASRWCLAETAIAQYAGIVVIPLRIDSASLDPHLALLQAVDCTSGDLSGVARALESAGVTPGPELRWDGVRAPFPGLRALDREDEALYFGREDELDYVLAKLAYEWERREQQVLVVQGGSGIGKSSFVRAGVLPQLVRQERRWLVLEPFSRYPDPLRDLVYRIGASAQPRWTGERCDVLSQELHHLTGDGPDEAARHLAAEIRRVFVATGRPPDCRVVVVLDQAEALASGTAGASASRFLKLLDAASRGEDAAVFLILIVRSEALPTLGQHLDLGVRRAMIIGLSVLDAGKLRRVVEEPARVARIPVDSGLAVRMAADAGDSHNLPLLAYTLLEMYRGSPVEDRRLTLTRYESLGGIGGAIRKQVEFLTGADVDEHERLALHRCFGRLVAASEDGSFVRRAMPWSESPELARHLLEELVDRRLLHRMPLRGVDCVELAHESLTRYWPDLERWLEENADFLRWRRFLEPLVDAWTGHGRSDDDLLRGRQLTDALHWYKEREPELTPDEWELIRRSDERERADAAQREYLYLLSEARRLAAVAQNLAREQSARDPSVALHLGIESLALLPTLEGDIALRAALRVAAPVDLEFRGPGGVTVVNASPDGRYSATGHESGLCCVYPSGSDRRVAGTWLGRRAGEADSSRDSPSRSRRDPRPSRVTGLSFSPDGVHLVIAGEDGTCRVLDVEADRVIATIRHSAPVRAVAVSPDGRSVTSAGDDGAIFLSDLRTGREVCRFNHDGPVLDLAVASDGRRIATASADRTSRVLEPMPLSLGGDPV